MNFYEINKKLHFSRVQNTDNAVKVFRIEETDEKLEKDENSDMRYFALNKNKNSKKNSDSESKSSDSSSSESSDSSNTDDSDIESSKDSEKNSIKEEENEKKVENEIWRKNRFDEYDIMEKETEPITTENRSNFESNFEIISKEFNKPEIQNEMLRLAQSEESDPKEMKEKLLLKERINQRLKGVLSSAKRHRFESVEEVESEIEESRRKRIDNSNKKISNSSLENSQIHSNRFERWKSENKQPRNFNESKREFHVPQPNEKMRNRKINNFIQAKKSMEIFKKRTSYVNKKSLQYLKNKRAKAPVEEILMNRGEITKWKREVLKEKLSHDHCPKITNYAKKLKRNGNVFSRLYRDGKRRVSSSVQRNTGNSQNKSKKKKSQKKNLFLRNGSEKKIFNPLTLPPGQSKEIKSLANYFTDHLSKNFKKNTKKPKKSSKPRIDNKKSKMFFERNMLWLHRKKIKLVEERNMKKANEMRECTFHPEIKDYSPEDNNFNFGDEGLITKDEFKIIFGGKTFNLEEENPPKNITGGLNRFFARNIEDTEISSTSFKNQKLKSAIQTQSDGFAENQIDKLYQAILKRGNE